MFGVTNNHARFQNLTYEDFQKMATNQSLSCNEKVGFPDSYRAGKELEIFEDIKSKLPSLHLNGSVTLDIGCGCSDIPRYLIKNAKKHGQTLMLLDSKEMLSQLPDDNTFKKIPARYPDCPQLLEDYHGKINSIIVYSVVQYIFATNYFINFLDESMALLAPQGRLLIGDVPNLSMRKRFFESESGIEAHRLYTGEDEPPSAELTSVEEGSIDDSVVLSMLKRARLAGMHAFVVPQASTLPMANRREDVLIMRP